MKVVSILVLMVCALMIQACAAQNDPRLQKLEDLAKEVVTTKEALTALTSRIESVETDVLDVKLNSEPYKSATFDPASPGGYSRLDTSGGTFLVSVKNAVPYVDGFRVTCNFGNPSTVTYKGFTVKAKWGQRFDRKNKSVNWSTWQSSLREKEISLTDTLQAGSWNPVAFVVSPAKAEEFGYLELSVETNILSLRK